MALHKHAWLEYADDLRIELTQAYDEGYETEGLDAEVAEIQALDPADPGREERAGQWLDSTPRLPRRAGYPYAEPSDLEGIRSERPGSRFPLTKAPSREELYDKLYGAWLGRSAGCLLGQPVEGWKRDRLQGFMKDTGNYPLQSYLSSDVSDELIDKYGIVNRGQVYGSSCINWINNVEHMVEDDDMNYTIIGLTILEKCGFDFEPKDVADSWLMNLPILHVCTAERIAYKNLVNRIEPPRSAAYRNVYREWIGAQIRADMFGYANPGNPEKAAEMAWRDASISHVKNGIYGEMWVAAMLAAAAVTDDIERIIQAGLAEIPSRSRLAEDVAAVLGWKREGIGWEEAMERIHAKYDENNVHHWCHANSNAMIVAMALLYGESDFQRSIGMAVTAAFDTDCNGATVGSILGTILGARALPGKWMAPLNDKIKSGVDGFGLVTLSELAERSCAIATANPYIQI